MQQVGQNLVWVVFLKANQHDFFLVECERLKPFLDILFLKTLFDEACHTFAELLTFFIAGAQILDHPIADLKLKFRDGLQELMPWGQRPLCRTFGHDRFRLFVCQEF